MEDIKLHALIDCFLDSEIQSLWLRGDYLEVYLRKGVRWLTERMETIELANLRTLPVQYQLQGIFPAFLTHLESKPFTVYVEIIGPPQLQWYFTRRGYQRRRDSYEFSCYRTPDN
jgi:hypothetical protein